MLPIPLPSSQPLVLEAPSHRSQYSSSPMLSALRDLQIAHTLSRVFPE